MNKHCLSKNIPLLSKSLLLKIIMVTSELSQRGTELLEGYYFTKRSDISFRISIFRSIEISSYRTIGFQFEILPPPIISPLCILDNLSVDSFHLLPPFQRFSSTHLSLEERTRYEWEPPWKMEGWLNYWGWRAVRSCPRNWNSPFRLSAYFQRDLMLH